MKTVLIPLKKIVRDEDLQMRVSTDYDHVDSIKEAITEEVELPAVKVWQEEGTELYFLGDGHHRYIAHEALNKEEILCEILKGGRDAALDYAFGANREHNALRRTTKDKQKALAMANKHHPKLSLRKLADKVGVSYMMVKRYRDDLKKCHNVTVSDEDDCNNVTPSDPQTDFFNLLEKQFQPVRNNFDSLLKNTGFDDPDVPTETKLKAAKDIKLNIKAMDGDLDKLIDQLTKGAA